MVTSGEKKIFKRDIFLLLIFGFFTFGVGYISALQFGESLSSHDHGIDHKEINNKGSSYHHEPLETSNNIVFDFELIQEDSNNWNLLLNLKGLRLSPENVGKNHVDGEGHAHVFIDGVKHGRIYSNWYHLGSIEVGSEVTVTFNSNNHKPFIKDGNLVQVSHRLTK